MAGDARPRRGVRGGGRRPRDGGDPRPVPAGPHSRVDVAPFTPAEATRRGPGRHLRPAGPCSPRKAHGAPPAPGETGVAFAEGGARRGRAAQNARSGVRDFDEKIPDAPAPRPQRPRARCGGLPAGPRDGTASCSSTSSRTPTRCNGTILRRTFHGNGTLVLVGDPKQAIYAFRGAEVLSYLDAVRSADRHQELTTNWRSDQELLDGLRVSSRRAALGHPEIVVHRVDPRARPRVAPPPAPRR